GLEVEHQGELRRVEARKGVVMATGGFPNSQSLRDQHFPKPTGMWSMALAENTGDGLLAGLNIGAKFTQTLPSPAMWAPVSLRRKEDGSIQKFPHLVWDRAKPGLIAVNQAGERFVNESASYH